MAIHDTSHDQPGDETRRRILDAAERLFAEQGFDRTSVREITQTAKVNQAAINYHFGGKEALYEAVYHRVLDELRVRRIEPAQAMMDATGGKPTLETLVHTLASAFVEPLLDGEQGERWLQLIILEMTTHRLPPMLFIERLAKPVIGTWADTLRQLRPELTEEQARLCVISVIGQLTHMITMGRMLRTIEQDVVPLPDLSRLIDHVTRFTVTGIRGYASPEDVQ